MPIPDYMQGRPFLGAAKTDPRQYVYGARDRVDEAYDLARSVRDKRYLYVRNYMPHISYNQPSAYSDMGKIRNDITRLAKEGKLSGPQLAYAGPSRPVEELYDTQADPLNLNNLAASAEHGDVLERMRKRHRAWVADTHDIGFLPEAEVWRRLRGTETPYDIARNSGRYDQPNILAAAALVGRGSAAIGRQLELLKDQDPAVRYWAAVGLRAASEPSKRVKKALAKALEDDSATVRVEAAGALVNMNGDEKALNLLIKELKNKDENAVLHACRTIQLLGSKARAALPAMQEFAKQSKSRKGSLSMFLRFSSEAFLKDCGASP
jgi:uncharacterized sulfatase